MTLLRTETNVVQVRVRVRRTVRVAVTAEVAVTDRALVNPRVRASDEAGETTRVIDTSFWRAVDVVDVMDSTLLT